MIEADHNWAKVWAGPCRSGSFLNKGTHISYASTFFNSYIGSPIPLNSPSFLVFMDANTTPSPTSPARTEAEFIEQANLAKSALKQFVESKKWENADDMVLVALNKLIKTTVCFCLSFLAAFEY